MAATSNRGTFIMDDALNQVRIVAPGHHFQSWRNAEGTQDLDDLAAFSLHETYASIVNGNVGVGSTIPNARLHVWFDSNLTSHDIVKVEEASSGACFVVHTNGNVGIGTYMTHDALTVQGNIVPGESLSYDLGTVAHRWRDLYLAGSTIHLGGVRLTCNIETGGLLVMKEDGTENNVVKEIEALGNVMSHSNIIARHFIGDGSAISNLDIYNFTGLMPVARGGIGTDFVATNKLLYGGETIGSCEGVEWSAGAQQLNIDGLLTVSSNVRVQNIWVSELSMRAKASDGDAERCVSSWILRSGSSPVVAGLAAICWAPELGMFVAVADQGTTHKVMTSYDGIRWDRQETPDVGAYYVSIAWSPHLGMFVAVSSWGTLRAMISSNGIDWIGVNVPSSAYTSVCWADALGIFIAVSTSGTIITSSNGTTWAISANMTGFPFTCICWSPEMNLLVALTSTANVATSHNAISWQTWQVPEGNPWKSVCWSAELSLFVAVAWSGTNRVMISEDGEQWTSVNVATNEWRSVVWCADIGRFVATASSGTHRIMTSSNGRVWSYKTVQELPWHGIAWSHEHSMFVAVANTTVAECILTSAIAEARSKSTLLTNPAFIVVDQVSGNVGIGTFSPTTRLAVGGTMVCYGDISAWGFTYGTFSGNGSYLNDLDATKITIGTLSSNIIPLIDISTGSTGSLSVARGGTGATYFEENRFLVGNGTYGITDIVGLEWDGASNFLGIGTLPQQPLHVEGNILSTGYVSATYLTGRCITDSYDEPSSVMAASSRALAEGLVTKSPIITGGASTIVTTNLTASQALVSDANGKVAVSAVTATELGHLAGVTSSIQTQLSERSPTITGGASTIATANLIASRTLVSDANGKVAVSAVTATELGYLAGVSNSIQTQLNNKSASNHVHAASDITSGTLSVARGGTGTSNLTGNGVTIQGNFGQWQPHSTYNNFNTTPAYWGWNFVSGNTNGPTTAASQWFRCIVGLGSEYAPRGTGGYSLEIAVPRDNPGLGAFTRRIDNGVISGWTHISAGHNHDGVYAAATHYHDDRYAYSWHNHDGRYIGYDGADRAVVNGSGVLILNNFTDGYVRNAQGAGIRLTNGNIVAASTGNGNCYLGWPDGMRWSTVYATGFDQGSDARLKKHVNESELGLEFLLELRPISYVWNQEGWDQKRHFGFLAQEVKAVVDKYVKDFGGWSCMDEKGEGQQGLAYTEFVAPIIKAIQTLHADKQALSRRVASLEADIQALKSRFGM